MDNELPQTEDPFELLGVDRSVDERDLKRAYARLIKKHRPERAPKAFQRIHAAYEEAKQMVQWGIAVAVFEDEDEDTHEHEHTHEHTHDTHEHEHTHEHTHTHEHEHEHTHEHTHTHTHDHEHTHEHVHDYDPLQLNSTSAERLAAAGDFHAARSTLNKLLKQDPQSGTTYLDHYRLTIRAKQKDSDAHRWLRQGLTQGARFDEDILDAIAPVQLGCVLDDDNLLWSTLRNQPAYIAATLFGSRIEQLLWDERIDQVVAELSEQALQDDLIANAHLEQTFRQAIMAIGWHDVDAADELHELFAHDAADTATHGAQYEDLRFWVPLPDKLPTPLARLITLGNSVSYERYNLLTTDLCDAVAMHPSAIVDGLSTLEYHRPGLFDYLGYYADLPDNHEQHDDSHDYTAILDDELAVALRQLGPGTVSQNVAKLSAMSIVALLGIYLVATYASSVDSVIVGLAAVVGTMGVIWQAGKENKTSGYHSLLRPILARVIGLEGIPLLAIRQYFSDHKRLRQHVPQLDGDVSLRILARIRSATATAA